MALHLGGLTVESPSFGHGGSIPDRHAHGHENVSPGLRWSNLPEGTREVVVVCHDPDAPLTDGFTHWIVYGIPAEADGIPEGGGAGFVEGTSDFGEMGYGGPAPPPGHGRHHYYFHVYALDAALGAEPGLGRAELLERIDDHIIEQARLVGTYER